MDWIFAIPALIISGVLIHDHRVRMSRARIWHASARALDLTGISGEASWWSFYGLTGWKGTRRLRFETGGQASTSLAVGTHSGITLRRETASTAFDKAMGEREFEIGDLGFDQEVYIRGLPAELRALLDPETRSVLLSLLRGYLLNGRTRTGGGSVEVVDGELRAVLPDSAFGEAAVFTEAVRTLLAVAEKLDRPADLVSRIADNNRRETDPGVRLQNVILLAADYASHAGARDAFRRACEDEDQEVRLRGALALGEEGRETLLQLASDESSQDSCAARAVGALGERLPLERALAILGTASRLGRTQAALACIGVLGRIRRLEAVEALVRVLADERGELAVAAAGALGIQGEAAAEGPLLDTLRRSSAAVQIAAVQALGRVGSAAAVLALKEAADAPGSGGALRRAARQAVAEIQSRLPGASPGQVSLAEGEAGQLSLAGEDPAGRVSIAEKAERG